jgi:hypothetical protein
VYSRLRRGTYDATEAQIEDFRLSTPQMRDQKLRSRRLFARLQVNTLQSRKQVPKGIKWFKRKVTKGKKRAVSRLPTTPFQAGTDHFSFLWMRAVT